jgi:acyl-CoA hydrolase
MVAVDDDRKPIAVPPLRPFTPEEKRRNEAAKLRKVLRREFSERFAAMKEQVG